MGPVLLKLAATQLTAALIRKGYSRERSINDGIDAAFEIDAKVDARHAAMRPAPKHENVRLRELVQMIRQIFIDSANLAGFDKFVANSLSTESHEHTQSLEGDALIKAIEANNSTLTRAELQRDTTSGSRSPLSLSQHT